MEIFAGLKSHMLNNRMRVWVAERPASPEVEIQCHVGTGWIHEEEYLGCGLSHFLEHMLFQGCRNYPGTAAGDRLHELGGLANAYTNFDATVYHAKVPKRHFAAAFEVLGSMVRYPEFPADRFAKESEVILSESRMYLENPDHRLLWNLVEATFNGGPLGAFGIGYPEKIAGVTREMMVDYYRRRYAPGRIFWVVVGAVDAGEVFAAMENFFGDWPPGRLDEPVIAPPSPPPAPRRLELEFADPLARIGVGTIIPGVLADETPAIEILNGVLTGGDASRLVRKLRQERSLAVDIDSFAYALRPAGILGITAAGRPGDLAALEKALFAELTALRRGGITAAEVKREKIQQEAARYRSLRSIGGIAAAISEGVNAGGTPDYWLKQTELLRRVEVDRVREAAEKYLAAENLTILRQAPPLRRAPAKKKVSHQGLNAEELPAVGGIRLFVLPDRRLPLADFMLVLPGGAIWEPAGQGGVSALICRLLTAGCGAYDEAAFARRLDDLGAVLSVTPGMNSMVLAVNVPSRNFERLFDLLLPMLSEPAFGPREFEREKRDLAEELASRRQQPGPAAEAAALAQLYGSHPYAGGLSGSSESLAALTAADCRRFYRRIAAPARCVAGFGGDLAPEKITALLARLAAVLPGDGPPPELPKLPEFPARPGRVEVPLERDQSMVSLSLPGITAHSPEQAAFRILAAAENGLAGRIFKSIREDHGLAYRMEMRQFQGFHPGKFSFNALTSTANAEKALKLLRRELKALAADGLGKAEFEAARDVARFGDERLRDNGEAYLSALVLEAFYGGDIAGFEAQAAALAGISYRECNQQLTRFFRQAVLQETVAGKIDREKKQRRKRS